jgi:2-amino-4-hydroxy-6-hydroxymethyldihydropteridine diphosphokinase
MNQKFKAYLSLGSNLNNKLENLQVAVAEIDKKIGAVLKCSSVYKTPSWGFDGQDFYNICIEINTNLPPNNLLKEALKLETTLGRKKKSKEGYQNRPIDIDIILYEDKIIETEELTIPHPRTLERKFVLLPLLDILKNFIFPGTTMNIAKCLTECNDKSTIEKTKYSIVLFLNK